MFVLLVRWQRRALPQSLLQARGAGVVTTTGRDVVLQTSLVTRERETVTDLVMEVSMMAMLVVREISCVGVTTAESLELTTMRRTTAVREQPLHSNPPSLPNLIGMRSRVSVSKPFLIISISCSRLGTVV